MSEVENRTIEPIQWFRGVAVLLVIGLHSIELVKFRHQQFGDRLGIFSSPRFYDHFGASGVDLFFVLSGFVMMSVIERAPRGAWKSFVSARLRRIVPLYWLVTAAMVLLLLSLGQKIDAGSLLVSFTIWPIPFRATLDSPVLVVGWSLAFELAFYAALAPLMMIPSGSRIPKALLTVLCLAILGAAFHPKDNFVALFLNPIWAEFALGVLLYLWWRRGMNHCLALLAGFSGAALLILGIAQWAVPETRPFAIYDGSAPIGRVVFWAMPWTGVLACALDIKARGVVTAALLRIGNASYSLYLTHMLIMTALLHTLSPGLIAPDLLPAFAIASCLGLGLITHDQIERPLLDYFRRPDSLAARLGANLVHYAPATPPRASITD